MNATEFEKEIDNHWQHTEAVIRNEYTETTIDEDYLKSVGFHYRTAMRHGFKHGIESVSAATHLQGDSETQISNACPTIHS